MENSKPTGASAEILIVEDSLTQAEQLRFLLERNNYRVVVARDGKQALAVMETFRPTLIISDVNMPEMDGYELCRIVKSDEATRDIPFILLTVLHETENIFDALSNGADFFIPKPYNEAHLVSHLEDVLAYWASPRKENAQEMAVAFRGKFHSLSAVPPRKMLSMLLSTYEAAVRRNEDLRNLIEEHERLEQELRIRQEQLSHILGEIRKDLEKAREMQASLLPPATLCIPSLRINWYFEPSSEIGGDLLNIFPVSKDYIAFYLFDVAGHGIHAALQTFSISRFISALGSDMELAGTPGEEIFRPGTVIRRLNEEFCLKVHKHHYFTITYGIMNTRTGVVRYVRAGHTPLIVRKADGHLDILMAGDMPVGFSEVFSHSEFEEQEIRLSPGDRMFLYSDGLVEAGPKRDNERYGDDRFYGMINATGNMDLQGAVSEIVADLKRWLETCQIGDDLSLLAIEFRPDEETAA